MATVNDYTRTTWQTGDVIDATKMNNIETQLDAVTDNARENGIAPVFSTTKTYAVGEHVLYNGEVYRCKTAVSSAGAWVASNWVKAYLSEDLGGEVSELKSALSGFEEDISEKHSSKNLLNEAELVTGYLNTANGNVNVSSETAYRTSGFIEVSQHIGKKLTFSNYNAGSRVRTKVTPNGYIFCNSEKTRIAGGTWQNDIDIPNNAVYVRICTVASVVAANAYPMLEVTEDGTMTDYEAYYEPYYTIRDSAIDIDDTLTKRGKPADAKATGDAISQYSNVIIPDRPKNLLNWNDSDVVVNAWLNNGVKEREGHSVTGYIDVHDHIGENVVVSALANPGNSRVLYSLPSYEFYNQNKERIAGGNWKSVIAIPDNAYYFRASLSTNATVIKKFYSIGVSTADKPQTLSDYYEKKMVVPESMIKHTLTCHLPQKLYILRNVAYELYFEQIFEEDVSQYKITQNGRSAAAISVFNNRIRFKVTAATTQTAIQILVYDKELLLDSFELQLVIADIPESEINLLPLGDSLTNHCVWESELMNIVPSLICVGSRNRNVADSDEETRTVYNDGRAGFTAANYLNGNAYTGGTDGGGNESPNNYWYDPVNEHFSMSYYMANHFPNNQNTPNALTYFLGMNDLSGSGEISDIIERMQTMIDDIRSYDSDLPLVIVSPQLQSLGDITFSTKKRFWEFAEALEELAGTYENVAYVALYPFMDSSNNYPTTEIGINTRNTRTELRVTDITHPANYGYWQIADLVAGAIAYLFSE